MLFENSMFNVLLSLDRGSTLKDDPLLSNEENKHDIFEFPTNDPWEDFSFSRLLSNASIWKQIPSNNGDMNTITPPNNALQYMDLIILPTLNTSIEHEIETPNASPTDVYATMVNDQ